MKLFLQVQPIQNKNFFFLYPQNSSRETQKKTKVDISAARRNKWSETLTLQFALVLCYLNAS